MEGCRRIGRRGGKRVERRKGERDSRVTWRKREEGTESQKEWREGGGNVREKNGDLLSF